MKKNTKLNLTSEFATRDKISLYEKFYTTLPDPDKILKANNYNYGIYRDLLTDPHLSAAIQQRKMQVLQMGWEISPPQAERIENSELRIENEKQTEKIKKEAIQIIQNLELQRISSDILDAAYFGFAVGEIQWELINNKIVPVDILSKPQEWFIFGKDNRLRSRSRQKYPPKRWWTGSGQARARTGDYIFEEGEELPEYKFVISQYQPSYVNPYGEKLLARCYWPITFKRAGIEQWHLISEKFGLPAILGYYTQGATEPEKQELLDQITAMLENNIAVMQTGTQIDFKENPKYEIGQLFEKLCEFHNEEISKAILSVTLTIENGGVGSYSATSVHQQMLGFIGIADKKLVELALNKMLRFYTDLNYGSDVESPKIKLSKKEAVITESEQRDKALCEMGVKFTKEYFMKRYNLTEEDFVLDKNEE